MTDEQIAPSAAMEKNAKLPARGGTFTLRHLENAARSVTLNADRQPIIIAD
jgi:hypothetical protein